MMTLLLYIACYIVAIAIAYEGIPEWAFALSIIFASIITLISCIVETCRIDKIKALEQKIKMLEKKEK